MIGKLKNELMTACAFGAKQVDPNQNAKKGRDKAKIMPAMRWVMEKTIVNTGLCI